MISLPNSKITLPPWIAATNEEMGGTTPPFQVKWLNKGDTEFRYFDDLVNPYNDHKPIFVARDGQEIAPHVGEIMKRRMDTLQRRKEERKGRARTAPRRSRSPPAKIPMSSAHRQRRAEPKRGPAPDALEADSRASGAQRADSAGTGMVTSRWNTKRQKAPCTTTGSLLIKL